MDRDRVSTVPPSLCPQPGASVGVGPALSCSFLLGTLVTTTFQWCSSPDLSASRTSGFYQYAGLENTPPRLGGTANAHRSLLPQQGHL